MDFMGHIAFPLHIFSDFRLRVGCGVFAGVRLKNAVVVIDEAHNLVDTVSALHSSHAQLGALQTAHQQLSAYLERYEKRLR